MKTRVLYELYNLTLPGGTGIATYGRNLCALAPELGVEATGLLHSWRSIKGRDPVLNEVSFFDARNRRSSSLWGNARLGLHAAVGDPFGLATIPLPLHSVVIATRSDQKFHNLDQILVASRFMDRSRLHFKRYGRAAAINTPFKPDIFHATQPVALRVPGARNIYTIHDIVPLRLPSSTLDDKKFFLNLVRYLGRTADRIVTVSEASRTDLIEVCGLDPEKVVNTYQSVGFPPEVLTQTREECARLVRRTFDLKDRDYYLFYGALEPKKNVGRLIDAFTASGTERSLILAGGLGWDYDGDLEKIEASRDRSLRIEHRRIIPNERIRRLQHLPLFQLVALIRCARAVVFPSLYEGFGLPVVEAMLLGTPVITSNTSSLGEVAGSAALLVDPLDVRSIANAIDRVDTDDALCEELSRRGALQAAKFSSEAHREKLAKVYEDAMAPRQG